jgi:hypothetical protein
LIFFAPLGVGVNEENQFAELGRKDITQRFAVNGFDFFLIDEPE